MVENNTYLGKDFLAQVGDVASATNFLTIAAMRTTALAINNEQIDITEKDVVPWRRLREGGVRSMDITLAGIVTDAATMTTLRNAVMSGQIRYFKVISGLGDSFIGKFQVASFERSGDHDKEEVYTLKLMSSGVIVYAP